MSRILKIAWPAYAGAFIGNFWPFGPTLDLQTLWALFLGEAAFLTAIAYAILWAQERFK